MSIDTLLQENEIQYEGKCVMLDIGICECRAVGLGQISLVRLTALSSRHRRLLADDFYSHTVPDVDYEVIERLYRDEEAGPCNGYKLAWMRDTKSVPVSAGTLVQPPNWTYSCLGSSMSTVHPLPDCSHFLFIYWVSMRLNHHGVQISSS